MNRGRAFNLRRPSAAFASFRRTNTVMQGSSVWTPPRCRNPSPQPRTPGYRSNRPPCASSARWTQVHPLGTATSGSPRFVSRARRARAAASSFFARWIREMARRAPRVKRRTVISRPSSVADSSHEYIQELLLLSCRDACKRFFRRGFSRAAMVPGRCPPEPSSGRPNDCCAAAITRCLWAEAELPSSVNDG